MEGGVKCFLSEVSVIPGANSSCHCRLKQVTNSFFLKERDAEDEYEEGMRSHHGSC